ncbi:MAG: hypothetical protein FJZ04_04000, partial [Candidatus Moranbacteria bacterium]|nr:hypothetical protein [Candidatus Moranbacteria bacterium]
MLIKKKEVFLVAAILIAGVFIRFFGLTCLPPGLYPDEAMNTTDGLTTAEAGGWKLFYENNQGREGLYINILGYLLHWFGNSLFVVRFLPALIGSLTLPAIYWIARRLTGRFGSLAALGLTAFSYWHLNFSRVGFRAILMVLLISWTSAFLIEGFYRFYKNIPPPSKKSLFSTPIGFFAVGGLLLGLSFHTYIAVRIFPAAIITLWALALIFFSHHWKSLLKYALVTAIFAAVTAAPMALDFLNQPEHFTGRTGNVSVLKSPNMFFDLGKSIGLTMLSFLFYGDQNWRHNYPYLPLVLPIWGIALLAGVIGGIFLFLKTLLKKFSGKKIPSKVSWQVVGWCFLISWWIFLLLPSIMTNEGLPHALRSIGAIPPTFLLVGLALDRFIKTKKIKLVTVVLLILTFSINVFAYFFLWGKTEDAFSAFEYRLSGIGISLRETIISEQNKNFYIITNQDDFRTDVNLPVAVEPIRFYTWQFRDKIKFIVPEDFDITQIKKPAKIVFTQDQEEITRQIQ